MPLNDQLRKRNADRLTTSGLHPRLAEAVQAVLDEMERRGFPMIVTDTLRTLQKQRALYAQGRTLPGKIVTYANGVDKAKGGTGKSNHQAWPDGFGHAVDCTFVVDLDSDGDMDDPTWDDARPWALYGATAELHGLSWGGRWKRPDNPHVELL